MSSWTEVFTNAASLAIAGTATAGALGWCVRKVWKGLGRVRRFLDDYEGTPERDGVPERPGVMKRLRTIEGNQVAQAQRLEAGDNAFDELTSRLDTFDVRLVGVEGQLQHLADELPKNGRPAAEKLEEVLRLVRELHQPQG